MAGRWRDGIQSGLRSAQPAFGDVAVGTLYFVTDEGLLERSTGAAWVEVAINETAHDALDHTGLTGVGGAGGSPVYDIERYTGGDITVNSTSAGADMAGVSDVVVAAATGDLLMIGLSMRSEGNPSGGGRVDVKFITGSTENYVSSLGTSPSAQGISAWIMGITSGGVKASGEVPYVVQAADISGGNVTLSLRSWVSSSSWVAAADADAPLLFWVRNLGQ